MANSISQPWCSGGSFAASVHKVSDSSVQLTTMVVAVFAVVLYGAEQNNERMSCNGSLRT